MNPSLFNASVESGAQGIVWAGVGAGGVSSKASRAAEAVYNATGIPFVASHRSSDGFVPNSEGRWTIGSGFYNPQKARIVLQLALSLGWSEDEIRKAFAKSYPMP
jgi:L-asparaginase